MKFRLKITLCMLCLLSLLFGIGGSALISISFAASLEREKESAHETYQMLLNTLQVVNKIEAWRDLSDVSNVLSQLLTQNASSWSALRISSQAQTVYELGASNEFSKVSHEEIGLEYCLVSGVSGPEGREYLQLSGAFVVGDETLYIDALRDITSIHITRAEQQGGYQRIYLCLVIVCALLTYSISWLLTRPLTKLTRASKAIAAGDLSYRTRITSSDEIGALSAEFDYMASQMEKNVEELKDAMERQERFTRSFTHELKTPMVSIIGYADLIRRQGLTPDEQAEAANYIFTEGKRLENLSIKLLEIFVTERKELACRAVSLSALIDRVVAAQRSSFERQGVTIYTSCEDGVCYVEPDLIWSLLVNLLDNARKALEPGGQIALTCKMTQRGCRIRLSDTGRGIDPAAMEHITEAFYRAPARTRMPGGAGLGLALCAKIVALHSGTMDFASKVGEGTCVTVELKGGRP